MPTELERTQERLRKRQERIERDSARAQLDAQRIEQLQGRTSREAALNSIIGGRGGSGGGGGGSGGGDDVSPEDFWGSVAAVLGVPIKRLLVIYGEPRTLVLEVFASDMNGAEQPTQSLVQFELGPADTILSQDRVRSIIASRTLRVVQRVKGAQWDAMADEMLKHAEPVRADPSERGHGRVMNWIREYAKRGAGQRRVGDAEAFVWDDAFDEDRQRIFTQVCLEGAPHVRDHELRFWLTHFRSWLMSPQGIPDAASYFFGGRNTVSNTLRIAGIDGPDVRHLFKYPDGSWYRRGVMHARWPLSDEEPHHDELEPV